MEDECRAFVNRREIEAVALEVPDIGATVGGERKAGRGGRLLPLAEELSTGGGCLSRMLRNDSSVRSTCIVSDDDESDEPESSSMGGVIWRGWCAGEVVRIGVSDRERKAEPGEEDVALAGGDLDCLTRRIVCELELVLELLPLRPDMVDGMRGEDDTDVGRREGERLTNEERTSTIRRV